MDRTSDNARIPTSYRPRRAMTVPRLAEADRPDPAELARVRGQLEDRRRRLPTRG